METCNHNHSAELIKTYLNFEMTYLYFEMTYLYFEMNYLYLELTYLYFEMITFLPFTERLW